MLNAYRNVWLIVLFDLPTESAEEKRAYRDFRGFLLEDGFSMMQYSVYSRFIESEEKAAVHVKRVTSTLPADGEVRILQITDKQLARMLVFIGKRKAPCEKPPEQLEFF